eukprot:CAMPEP_0116089328 /NCGR_PEP_ID=MMETSP0327-20121206/6368_1 /TAXON_ID=44447 /ORGANISM="Pseudo-nitzschia delicatissima, Strain B596" /LENGTH=380 /DNA_ID=CAMNT_0003580515 /DNA_START=131 /DNA_END=1273 /DNA_ORIENTATION=-
MASTNGKNNWLKMLVLTVVILSLSSSVLSSLYFTPRAEISIEAPEMLGKVETSLSESKSANAALEVLKIPEDEKSKPASEETVPELVESEKSESVIRPEIDWSDGIFQRGGWDKDPIVIESHKLLFFTVPKNACTTFKKLFRRMMGYQDWLNKSPHDPAKNGLRYLGHYSREQQQEMMTSPEWTRAIFVRDPLERALSAYMEKALQVGDAARWTPAVEGAYIKRLCCGMLPGKDPTSKRKVCQKYPLAPYESRMNVTNFPFETFVDKLMKQCKDPHWGPQSKRMDKPSNWQFINFVGHFENRKADTHALMRRIGAFDEYGFGWDKSNKSLAIFETNTALHKTGSSQKMEQHYTKLVRKRVFEHYKGDYQLELFNLTSPLL